MFRSKLLPLLNKFWICFKCHQHVWIPFIFLPRSEWRVSIYNKVGRVEPECLLPWMITLCIQLIMASLLCFSFIFSAKNWKFILNRKETGLLTKINWLKSPFVIVIIITSNNQRLRSAGDNDRRSKCFCSNAVLCVSFTWEIVKIRVIR